MKITSREIALTLMADRYQRNFVLPGYTPAHWWECDVFEITPAGYFYEYEIKISKADFLVDRDKSREIWPRLRENDGTWKTEKKHDLLKQRAMDGPSMFNFVTLPEVAGINDVPEWAGLIHVVERSQGHRLPHRIWLQRIKESPRLHKKQVDEKLRVHANSVCYWRMHNVLNDKARADLKDDPKHELPEMTEFACPGASETKPIS